MKDKIKRFVKTSPLFKIYKKTRTIFKSKKKIPGYTLADFPEISTTGINFITRKNRNEYLKYALEMADEFKIRQLIEQKLSENKTPVYLKGIDPVTKKITDFYIGFEGSTTDEKGKIIPNLRETVLCENNRFNSRIRATVIACEKLIPETKRKSGSFYLTEQVTDFYYYFKENYHKVTGSEYLGPQHKSGEIIKGLRHEDITALSFKNDTFDGLITLEVLEHVPDFKKSFGEMYRVLKPGGIAIITAPFHFNKQENTIRATINSDGNINHILPPEYHGDPVNEEGGILCFQHFGWELIDQLKQTGFKDAGVMFIWSLQHAILGGEIGIIYAVK